MNTLLWLALGAGAVYLVTRGGSGAASGPQLPPYAEGHHYTAEERRAAAVAIQTALQAMGYYRGNIDGIVRQQTEAAVQAFMRDRPALARRIEAQYGGTPRAEYEMMAAIVRRAPAEV